MPTASQKDGDTHDTPLKPLGEVFGLGTTDQEVPFQSSVKA